MLWNPWYLKQIKRLVKIEEELLRYNVAEDIPHDFFRELKELGYSDAQIAWVLRIKEEEVTWQRKKLGIRRTYKMVDTCAAEFEAAMAAGSPANNAVRATPTAVAPTILFLFLLLFN